MRLYIMNIYYLVNTLNCYDLPGCNHRTLHVAGRCSLADGSCLVYLFETLQPFITC